MHIGKNLKKRLERGVLIFLIIEGIVFLGWLFFTTYFMHPFIKYSGPIVGMNGVNDTLRMYKNDDIRMYNFNCITDTIVEVITTCNTYTLLTVHLL